MKHSTLKKILIRKQNLPIYFVDSCVLLEVLFHQSKYDECLAFLNNTGYHYRLMTSTLALGEIIKSLHDVDDETEKLKGAFLLFNLLEKTEIQIVPVSLQSINNAQSIRDTDQYLASSDLLIFSSAITENCKAFITLDSDFSARLGNEFNIRIEKPFYN